MKIGYLFSVPLVDFRMDDHEDLCARLSTLFLKKAAEDHEVRNKIRRDTQFGDLFESRFDLFNWQDEPVKELAAFCHRALASVIFELSDYTEDEFSKLVFDYHAWFHITKHGGFQALHHHQNASWSGIFCVDPGDSPAEFPQSGAVRFHDTRGLADQYRDAANNRLKLPARFGGYQIDHEAGRLLIFPSYVDHEIFTYMGKRERIVVAFNCMVKKSQPAG
ncbi:MAG: hypothetical protein IH835_06280 [Proteobacteria bacterium]|nr:hypothetical protein [Pseudomonadota bacterium]